MKPKQFIFVGLSALMLLVLTACRFAPEKFRPSEQFVLTIEWNGAVKKPVYDAALGGIPTRNQLKAWQGAGTYRNIAILSANEVACLSNLVESDRLQLLEGSFKDSAAQKGYILTVSSPKGTRHKFLGMGIAVIPTIETLNQCLGDEAKKPLAKVMENSRY